MDLLPALDDARAALDLARAAVLRARGADWTSAAAVRFRVALDEADTDLARAGHLVHVARAAALGQR